MADVRFNMTLTEHQHDWLRRVAFARRVSMAEIMRRVTEQAMTAGSMDMARGDASSLQDCIELLQGEISEVERVRSLARGQASARGMLDGLGIEGDYGIIDEALVLLINRKRDRIRELQRDIWDLAGEGETDLMPELLDHVR